MMTMITGQVLLLAAFSLAAGATAESPRRNSLARTPPMGWMSWEIFRCEDDCETNPASGNYALLGYLRQPTFGSAGALGHTHCIRLYLQ